AFQLIRGFAKGRRLSKPGDALSRLYVVEALMSLAGANADHRLRLPASAVTQAAALFAEKLTSGPDLVAALKKAGPLDEKSAQWVAKCAEDLLKPENRGKSLVLAGHRQPLAVHLAAQAINSALGNVGSTVVYYDATGTKPGTITELRDALNGNAV